MGWPVATSEQIGGYGVTRSHQWTDRWTWGDPAAISEQIGGHGVTSSHQWTDRIHEWIEGMGWPCPSICSWVADGHPMSLYQFMGGWQPPHVPLFIQDGYQSPCLIMAGHHANLSVHAEWTHPIGRWVVVTPFFQRWSSSYCQMSSGHPVHPEVVLTSFTDG